MSLSLNVVKEKEKEEDIEKKGQNENEGDIEESQVSMVIDEDVDSDTGTCGQDTASPLFTPYPPFFIFFLFSPHFHGLEICKTAIICRFLIA